MPSTTNRRQFLKMTALSGASLAFVQRLSRLSAAPLTPASSMLPAAALSTMNASPPASSAVPFVPNRMASWWCTIDHLEWPQKHVRDKIKRRADGFAAAQIDTAINFGFHNRFDFSNYFDRLHGYYNNVCEELHQRGIRFMDHYSCNHVCRPRTAADLQNIHQYERLAVLLFPDPIAARFAQYEGHLFQDLCEVDLRDGSRGYASQYQYEAFCHNNPGLHDMHKKYLLRLMKEVPFDGIEVDDMCSYPGNTTCGCQYCRERFKRDYGHDIPAFSDKTFFGDTGNPHMLEWGNYDNPLYRDWLRMKAESIRDHIKMIKEVLGDKPLMTCCSNTGPIILNAVALNLEKMAPYLDLFMLENVGTNIDNANWMDMEGEAMLQKDIAAKRGNAPAIALSYTITYKGAYLGWALARFWGVSNWSSTLNSRLIEDPPHALEMEEAISQPNNWEKKHSDLYYREGADIVEVRLVNNSYCRENGWRDEKGHEHWDRSKAWSNLFLKHNVGYRFVRSAELEDTSLIQAENIPLVLDGVGCVSDKQFAALTSYLTHGGTAWLALPFGTHDEKGFARKRPLSDTLQQNKSKYKNLHLIDSAITSASAGNSNISTADPLQKFIASGQFTPILRQQQGDTRWAARIRLYNGKPAIHFMNTALTATPDTLKDLSGIPLIKDLDSAITDNDCIFEVDTRRVPLSSLTLLSPEWDAATRPVTIRKTSNHHATLHINLEGAKIYAIAQGDPS